MLKIYIATTTGTMLVSNLHGVLFGEKDPILIKHTKNFCVIKLTEKTYKITQVLLSIFSLVIEFSDFFRLFDNAF